MRLLLLLLVVGSLFLGCNQLHRDAQTLMEGENYGDAAKVYERILKVDPSDAKAIVGLKKARLGWIDKKLLDVRMLRLAEQAGPASELLKQIIKSEREWQFYPEGAVQYTQEEETQYAVRFIKAQTDAWSAKGHFLKARAFLDSYSLIFSTSSHLKQYEELNFQIASLASKQCKNFQQEIDSAHPYHAAFVIKYCQSWGISIDRSFDVTKVRASALFKNIEFIGQVGSIPEAQRAFGREGFTKELQVTAWYDPDAIKSLPLIVKAEYSHVHTKTVEHTVHSYTVKVPYTVMIPQPRSYQVPQTTYTTTCNAFGCTQIPFTTYITKFEIVMVPVTQYRDDPRQFPYDRWSHHQILKFNAELNSKVAGTEANAVHNNTEDNTDFEHTHSVPEADLYPHSLNFPDPITWLQAQISETARNWGVSLSKAWIRLYCNAPESAVTGSTLTDYIFRCLREQQMHAPSFVEAWYKEQFGAGQEDVEKWIVRVPGAKIPSTEMLKTTE